MIINQLFEKVSNTPNFKSISLIIKLFRVASKGDEEEPDQTTAKYLKDPDDYQKVIQFTLLQLPKILREFYEVDFADNFTKEHISQHIQQVIVRGFFIKALNFLEHTIETQETEENTILFVIKAISQLNSVLSAFDSLQKKALKLLIQIWGENVSLQIKLHSFIQLRLVFGKMADHQQNDILKKFYEKYLETTKHIVWRNYEGINFMINCITELCNMNMNQAYQVVYLSLQKLVKKLRDASVAKTEQNVASIYNQQTLNLLKLWTKVICTHKSEKQLADLMSPLIQIIQSVLDFYPSIDNYTFQLQLLDLLIQISKTYKVNQNLLSYLLRMLNCAELKRRKLKSSVKPYDFEINIHIKPKYKQSGTFWADFCQQVVNKIIIYLSIFSKETYFQEYTYFLEKQLKRISQDFGFDGNKIKIKELIKLIQSNIDNKNKKKESNLESEAQRLIYEQEELIKQKVLAEKEREQKGEELEESEQEINDEKEQEYVLEEIKKYKQEKKEKDNEQQDYANLSDYEGDPENFQEEQIEDEFDNNSDS